MVVVVVVSVAAFMVFPAVLLVNVRTGAADGNGVGTEELVPSTGPPSRKRQALAVREDI